MGALTPSVLEKCGFYMLHETADIPLTDTTRSLFSPGIHQLIHTHTQSQTLNALLQGTSRGGLSLFL
jgi:hypothetical protein